ncbi:MAG: Transcriptional regulatory protein FixJ [Paracidovorax wautersii]|uniref:Transcriptional regulatory protein FixJ n=1 Tax=Paracidovorax wautersii TaxID=1177982 RepID=A0A7V8FNR0_9BURK|nr:MAG: Transcriptional regulatory protein FixJ [Paracidovorax wautersii]
MSFSRIAAVHVIDDDASVRDALGWLLHTRHQLAETYPSAEAFLAALDSEGRDFAPAVPCCLLLDVRMPPGMSGLELFQRLLDRQLLQVMPVIFLSGHADVSMAVDAVKRGAFDFCEKPFSDNALVDRVEQALSRSQQALAQLRQTRDVRQLIERELTERERGVMELVVQGLSNKQVADQLDISVRTVEVHRARVFEKMNVKSAVELANLLHHAR